MTASIDLRPDHLKIVQDILAEHLPQGASARAFGSRVKWTAKAYSDLDLAIKGPDAVPSRLFDDLSAAFSESDLPFKIDLVDWIRASTDFRSIIEKTSVPLPWPERPLREFVSADRPICYGIVQPGAPVQDGVPVLRVNNFTATGLDTSNVMRIAEDVERSYGRSRLQGGELLITLVGSVGLTAIVPPEMKGWNVARAVGVIPLANDADIRWINFVLRSRPAQDFMAKRANTTVQTTFNLKDLAELPIAMPPAEIRRPMSDMLAALDDKIELNRRMNETLEASARTLFRDWFVDFGPTRARAEGRPAYLTADLWSLFPDGLGNDGAPIGWRVATLADLAKLNPQTWGTKDHPAMVRYVDLSNTKWGYIEKVETYCWDNAPSRARRVLNPNDTIIGTVRPGNGSYAFIAEQGLTGSTGFAVLRPAEPAAASFVWCAATAPENIERLTHLADGGAYPAVRPEVILATEAAIPSRAVLAAFEEAVKPMLDQVAANKAEARTLAETRDTLLPKLMSGEIRLHDAEALAA